MIHQHIDCVYLEAYANHLMGVKVMVTVILQCNSYSHTFKCLFLSENSIADRASIGEVLTQVWLKSIKK